MVTEGLGLIRIKKGYEAMGAFIRNGTKWVWVAFANASMQKKLIVVFIFLITIPILLASYISYRNYSKSIQDNSTTYVKEVSSKIVDKLDDYVKDLKQVSASPLYLDKLQEYLMMPETDVIKERFIQTNVYSMENIKGTNNTSVYIKDKFGHLFYTLKTEGIRTDLKAKMEEWGKLAHNAKSALVISTERIIHENTGKSDFVFSVIRELRNIYNLEPIGLIVFESNLNVIKKAVENMDSATKGSTIIVDEHKQVIYDSGEKLIGHNLADDEAVKKATDAQGSFPLVKDRKPYLISYSTSVNTGWTVYIYIPTKVLTAEASTTRNITILVTLIIIGFALFISIIISYALTRPLRKMAFLMREVQLGNLNVGFNVKYRDEIGLLGNHFNRMILRIKQLIDEVYSGQKRKREAEIKVLQSQINPHFIYNTLETIRMMAEINDDEKVASMAYILGSLLRYSIINVTETVTVAQELEHLENYIYLQNVRFKDKFHLVVLLADELKQYRILKLMLQPIVENAIYHGLEKIEGHSEITIQSHQDESFLYITISDNGEGIDLNALQLLNDRISNPSSQADTRHGIGLSNVNDRIQLYYGEEYGLKIESAEGTGTRITLRLPNLMH
jgi:two-component system sensor histidine kinase YesM